MSPEHTWATEASLRQGAELLLAEEPDPAVAVRLLRDVLEVSDDDPRLVAAVGVLDANVWVRQLATHQRGDGGWGRFHSRDSSLQSAVPTTEWAVQRCLALGVDVEHPIGRRATRYLEEVLCGRRPFPDPAERNDRWQVGVDLFAASTLCLLDPDSPALLPSRALWIAILERAFVGGRYDQEAEAAAHRELTGATVAGGYLVIRNRYTLALLGSAPDLVPTVPLMIYADWVAERGAGYLEVPALPPPDPSPGVLDRWLTTLELLAPLPGASERLRPAVAWLDQRRGEYGFWDLGPRPPDSPAYPISADWRSVRRRRHDHTARVLALLAAVNAR